MFRKAVVVDRSILAANMYRLLLKPVVDSFLFARRMEEAQQWFLKPENIGLAIFDSSTLRKSEEYLDIFAKIKIPKIFVCREKEAALRKRLKGMAHSRVVVRPFNPRDFLSLVKRMVGDAK